MLSSAATATATATSVSARSGEILCSYSGRKTVAPFRFAQSVYCKSLRPRFVAVRAMAESQTAPRSQPQSSGFSGKKQALISLSDKRDLATLGNGLQELGYTIFSTGGTASTLENAGVSVTKVETLTHFPEMLDGRVKTLHPSIHGGILARRDMEHHMEALNKHRIGTFDVVVVNLYPFYDKVTAPGGISFEDGIENIDIGGPAMIRAAAKNHKDVLIVVDSEDYQAVLEYLKGGQSDQQFRRKLAWKAFQHVAAYDSAVSEWLWKQTEGKEKFPPSFTVPLSLKSSLRYGENPHQKAAFYVDKSLGEVNAGGIATAIQHHGKLMQSRAWLRLRSYYRGTTVFPISDHVRSEQPSDLVRWVCSSSYPGNLKPRREGYISNPNVARPEWLISRLCKEGRIAEARKLFDGLPERDVITWTDVITGYIKLGNMREARELFDRGDSKKNVVTWTAMVSGYLRSKQFSAAEMLFQEMPERNIVSWNTMIDGYAQSGRIDKALELFDEMPEKNTVSWNTIIKALVMRGRIEEAMSLFEKMPIRDVISWTAMVDGLAKNGKVDEARWVFDCMPERNIVSWNAMITGYAHNNRIDEADKLFQVMPERDFASWNTMITGFIRNGEINKACILFDRMPEKNVISWTTMITGYVQNKENEDALKIFSNMLTDGSVKPNVGTYVSILSACSDLAGLVEGQQIHQLISKSVHQENELVTSALINMYSKSGKLVAAKKIFDYGLESQRDLISWNSMIVVYAHHGRGKEAIEMYEQMRKHEFKPNEVTYLNLLSACSHAGLVEKGMEFFEELVKDKSLSLREDHYTCLVDLCGRAGRLKDVLEFINSDEAKPSGSVYGALLSACNVHGELSIAKEVVKKVLETGSDDAGTYVMMSNMYKRSGKGEEAAEMRMKMKERGLKKQPGCSWIAIGNKRHAFVVGDLSHPRFEALDSVVSDLNYKMRKNKNMTSEAEEDEFLVI